jgi:hypothetical protein
MLSGLQNNRSVRPLVGDGDNHAYWHEAPESRGFVFLAHNRHISPVVADGVTMFRGMTPGGEVWGS